MFTILDPSTHGRKRRTVAFTCAVSFQVLLIGATAFIGIMYPEQLPVADRHYALTWLMAMVPPEKPPLQLPPREVLRPPVLKVQSPEPPKLTLPVVVEHAPPKAPIPPPLEAARVPEPPLPVAPAQPSAPPQPKQQVAVHTGLFGGAAEPVTSRRPLNEVQTGGFGNPEGLPGHNMSDRAANVPKVGAFGLPSGPGEGNGTGGHRGVPGVVASAGFGSGIASMGDGKPGNAKVAIGGFETSMGSARGSGGSDGPKVAVGGFEKAPPVATPAKAPSAPSPVVFLPVEIISKPAPVYTQEARQLKIQGEVALSVVFEATGGIKVISVVKSLGHGLDEAAAQAAAQIRFKPAQRDGKAADFPATLRIVFRLADQSS